MNEINPSPDEDVERHRAKARELDAQLVARRHLPISNGPNTNRITADRDWHRSMVDRLTAPQPPRTPDDVKPSI